MGFGMNPPAPSYLHDCIAGFAARKPELPVLTFVSVDPTGALTAERRTYRELDANGTRLAHALIDAGIKPGDHFAVMMDNHPEFIEAMIASSLAGSVYAPIDPRTRGQKLRYMLDSVDCAGAIIADRYLPRRDTRRIAEARMDLGGPDGRGGGTGCRQLPALRSRARRGVG